MDTNSYINLSDNCPIFDNLHESIKEFYNNFLKLFNDTCDINAKNIYIGNWKLLSINQINTIYEKNLYNKKNIDILLLIIQKKLLLLFIILNILKYFSDIKILIIKKILLLIED